MDNVEYVSRTCVVCGKAFTEVKHPSGNKRKFCSHECELAHRREYRRKYFQQRYEEDSEYRKKVKAYNSKHGVERRKSLREAFIDSMVATLAGIDDEKEIKNILEENFRVKSEKYDKHARTLRVPKEGNKQFN